MYVRRRMTSFRPALDILSSRIAPTIFVPIDPVSMSSGDTLSSETTGNTMTQTMPADADEMVGPSY